MALLPMSLRLEAADGSGGEEYRIHDGEIEVRKLGQRVEEIRHGVVWHRVTPGELSSHVHENTVVAQWLERRIGWRRLLWACANQESSNDAAASENTVDRYAA
jgi:hypothetical protein